MQLRSRRLGPTGATAHQSRPVMTKATKAAERKTGMKKTGKEELVVVSVTKPKDAAAHKTNSAAGTLDRSGEKAYLERHRYVIGVDEAGRGPLAGPVVAAACIVDTQAPPGTGLSAGAGVMDSKATSEAGRERTYAALTSAAGVYWSVCRVEHDEIDQLNILQASMAAMSRAVRRLLDDHPHISPEDCVVLVDGNRLPEGLPSKAAEYVIKGDSRIYSIAAASIIAKITRDRIMQELHVQYPQYNLAKHKGYPTMEHRTLLIKHGPSVIHRYSYRPVAEAAVKHNIPFSVPLPKPKVSTTGGAKTKSDKKAPAVATAAQEPAPSSVEDAVQPLPVSGHRMSRSAASDTHSKPVGRGTRC